MADEEFPIIWLPAAAEDLREIHEFIGWQSQAYADGMIDRIIAAVEDLSRFPRKGHRVEGPGSIHGVRKMGQF